MCDTYSWLKSRVDGKLFYFNTQQRKQLLRNGGKLKVFRRGEYKHVRFNPDSHTHIMEYYGLVDDDQIYDKFEYKRGIKLNNGTYVTPFTVNRVDTWDIGFIEKILDTKPGVAPVLFGQISFDIDELFISTLEFCINLSPDNQRAILNIIEKIIQHGATANPFKYDMSGIGFMRRYQKFIAMLIAAIIANKHPRNEACALLQDLKTAHNNSETQSAFSKLGVVQHSDYIDHCFGEMKNLKKQQIVVHSCLHEFVSYFGKTFSALIIKKIYEDYQSQNEGLRLLYFVFSDSENMG